MIEIDIALVRFFALSFLLGLTPGPDNLYVLIQSAKHGKKTGLYILLGLCTGLIVHTLAVTLGLTALFVHSSNAFNLLKYLGAAYLLYLAYKIASAPSTDVTAIHTENLNHLKHYTKGIALNLTNPKVALFFIAFLPQFIPSDSPNISIALLSLGLIFISATLASFGIIICLSAYLRALLITQPPLERLFNWLTSVIFVVLSLRLMLYTTH